MLDNSLVCPGQVDGWRGVDPGHGAGDVQVRRVSLRRASGQDPDTGGRGWEEDNLVRGKMILTPAQVLLIWAEWDTEI